MTTQSSHPDPAESSSPKWLTKAAASPAFLAIISACILLLDLLSGPHLLFPILFVIPVTMAAWFISPRWAYSLAVFLPIGRFLIAEFVDLPSPTAYIIANTLIRISVLCLLAYFVGRTSLQTKQLKERVSGLVMICAWSRTIEYKGEWISFEQYLKRRFDIDASHGISPTQAQKIFGNPKNWSIED